MYKEYRIEYKPGMYLYCVYLCMRVCMYLLSIEKSCLSKMIV